MKKTLIACVGLLLLVSFGCSSEDEKKSFEKTKETVIETATEAKDKAVEMSDDAVKATKETAEIEGC